MAKKKQKNKNFEIKINLNQNVILTVLLIFLMFFGIAKAYTNHFSYLDKQDEKIDNYLIEEISPTPKPTKEPIPTSTPRPTMKPWPTTKPYSTPAPLPTMKPIPTLQPYPTYSYETNTTSVLTEEQIQKQKEILQLEIDICKSETVQKYNDDLRVCYTSRIGTDQEYCIKNTEETYERSMKLCVANYESGMSALE